MDLAELGVKATQTGVDTTNSWLEKLTGTASKAEDATGRFNTKAVETGRATTEMNKQLGAGSKLFSTFGLAVVGAVAALATMAASAVSVKAFVDATSEAEKQQAQLAAALKSTAGASGQTVESLNEYAASLQGVTNFGDEAINQAQALLLTFTKIGGDVFPRATTAIADMAQRMGTDLQSATIQVGKALNDPVLGVTALGRAGVQFTDTQKDMIKAMVAANDIVGAQTLVLAELEKQFGGSAEAARKTLGGALTSLSNVFGDLFEVSGPATDTLRMSIEGLIVAISSPAFKEFANTIGSFLFDAVSLAINAMTGLANILPTILDLVQALAPAVAVLFGPTVIAGFVSVASTLMTAVVPAFTALGVAIAANPFGLIVTAITAVIGILYTFREELGLTSGIWADFGNTVMRTLETIGNLWRAFWEYAGPTITKMGELVVNLATAIGTTLVEGFQTMWGIVKPLLDGLLAGWNAVLDVINAIVDTQDKVKAPAAATPTDVSKPIATGFKEGADAAADTLADSAAKSADAAANTATDAAANAADKTAATVGSGVTDGGASAANSLTAAIQGSAQVMAAKFEGTGRNIYDLWNNWGNSFINNFGVSIGDLLVKFQQAQTRQLEAQARLLDAQAELTKEQAEFLDRKGYMPGTGPNNTGGTTTGGGVGTEGSSSASAPDGPIMTITDPTGANSDPGKSKKRRNSNTGRTYIPQNSDASTKDVNDNTNGKGRKWQPLDERSNVRLRIVNQNNPRDTLDNIQTSAGEQTILNVLANKRGAARRILGGT